MRDEYIKIIEDLDTTIAAIREQWVEASPDDKPLYMEKLNDMLDNRLRLMRTRDSFSD